MGLGDFISGVFGSKNEEADKLDPYKTDPNAYEYGGHPGGAQQQALAYGSQGGTYTQGAQNSFSTAAGNFGNAGEDRNAAYGARAQQQDALGLIADRAKGNDLISSRIAAQNRNQIIANGQSGAASARGPGALALAQGNAAATTAQGLAQTGANEQINAAQEKLANEQAYLGGASGIRGQDIGQMGATTALGAAQSNSGAQQGGLGLGFSNLQNNVYQSQLVAQQNKQAQDSANYNAAHGIQAGAQGQNAQTNQQNAMGLIGAVAQGGGAALAAKGGDFKQDAPYLVGEQGPELVVPKKDGFVLTALQTAALRGAPPTHQQMMGLAQGGRARAAGGPVLTRDHAANGPPPGDPNAPQAQYQPGYGWYQPDPQKQQLVDEIASTMDQKAAQDEKDVGYEEMDRKIAAMRSADNASEAKKIQSSFASPKEGEKSGRAGRFGAGLVSGIGSSFSGAAKHVDTGYHPPAAYQSPQLLALPARAFGGPMNAMHPLDDANAGELGQGGVGGFVAGTIGHENSDVRGAFKPMSGLSYAREEGGPIEAERTSRRDRYAAPSTPQGRMRDEKGRQILWEQALHARDPRTAFVVTGPMPHGEEGSIEPVTLAGAREEGGVLSSIAEHGSRLIHHIASSVAHATEPEAIAIERKAPRAAASEKNDLYTTGTGWPAHASAPTTATLSRPGPKEYAEKVTRAKSDDDDDKARACGGLMLAPGKRRRVA